MASTGIRELTRKKRPPYRSDAERRRAAGARESGRESVAWSPGFRIVTSPTSHLLAASSAIAQAMAPFIWPPQPSPPPGPRDGDRVAVELDPPELAPPDGVETTIMLELDSTGRIESALEALKATKAIAAKAVQVGALATGADPDVETVP